MKKAQGDETRRKRKFKNTYDGQGRKINIKLNNKKTNTDSKKDNDEINRDIKN